MTKEEQAAKEAEDAAKKAKGAEEAEEAKKAKAKEAENEEVETPPPPKPEKMTTPPGKPDDLSSVFFKEWEDFKRRNPGFFDEKPIDNVKPPKKAFVPFDLPWKE